MHIVPEKGTSRKEGGDCTRTMTEIGQGKGDKKFNHLLQIVCRVHLTFQERKTHLSGEDL